MKDYHALIRGNNLIWSLLYYDEVFEHTNFQLSYFSKADQPYYNCAHAVKSLNELDIQFIEDFYNIKNLKPGFYTDPSSEPWLIPYLIKRNYKELPSQRENWWLIGINSDTVERLRTGNYLKFPLDEVSYRIVQDETMLQGFISINKQANQLNQQIINALTNNIKNKQYPGITVNHFLGLINHQPAFCGSLGIYGSYGYLAEDGTLDKFRRCGLQSFITQQRILYAYSQGVLGICTTCSVDSYTNYSAKKLGFELLFTRRFFSK